MWTYNNVKESFIAYFTKKNHLNIPSSSLVPPGDSSLLFTNSGMVQFKNIFLGNDKSKNLRLACNSQRCIRAGGKHNDLDDVGKDSYHHTFFEMLGSWSFNYNENENKNENDNNFYFKSGAIKLAWDLLINVYGLDKNRMYVTYFGGNKDFGLDADIETKNYWMQFLPEERILPFGMKENFWEMGYTGPCGPCTEIHYDRIGERDASMLVNCDDPTVIEIWNLVFMQYYRNSDTSLTKLTNKHVDTGMGLERLVSILQNCTNYQIDLFRDIMNIIEFHTKAGPYSDCYGPNDPYYINTSYRVIADHVRTMIFAINDGVVPEPTERGYVLRRIIRRAIRYCSKLNTEYGLLTKIVADIIDFLGKHDTVLIANKDNILKTVADEETKFGKTMTKGLRYFRKITKYPNSTKTSDLINLYTTYGFPIDIIKQLCEEERIPFNYVEYEVIMKDHIEKSKQGKQFKSI
ncbi:alanyl-tRNA synthetase [Tupanvirus deep ocean]|uniref:Alanyl-tRNA synthetase n=2 Tax=Tupanvirus TaxID=2094720 RepID=A0AC62A798_9VIRU|nr:alanyl-tRNA synthetase [Tupanvirus deep ocean]QKU33644.1 alanyl-tRNA synthetase [Tupanvirus deep ocean]